MTKQGVALLVVPAIVAVSALLPRRWLPGPSVKPPMTLSNDALTGPNVCDVYRGEHHSVDASGQLRQIIDLVLGQQDLLGRQQRGFLDVRVRVLHQLQDPLLCLQICTRQRAGHTWRTVMQQSPAGHHGTLLSSLGLYNLKVETTRSHHKNRRDLYHDTGSDLTPAVDSERELTR